MLVGIYYGMWVLTMVPYFRVIRRISLLSAYALLGAGYLSIHNTCNGPFSALRHTYAEVRLLFRKSDLGGQQLQLNVLRLWRNPYSIALLRM